MFSWCDVLRRATKGKIHNAGVQTSGKRHTMKKGKDVHGLKLASFSIRGIMSNAETL